MRNKFPKSSRLLYRKEFLAMNQAECKYCGCCIIVDIRKNRFKKSRLGITVSKRFGKSHQRNRFKRIVREAYRTHIDSFSESLDLHVRPRKRALEAKASDIYQELVKAYLTYRS